LDDDFSSGRGWLEYASENINFYYVEGGYRIRNDYSAVQASSIRSFTLSESFIETTALQVDGENTAYYGPVCRWQDTGNFYGFGINARGGYAIYRLEDGFVTFLDQGQDDPLRPVLRPGENRITAHCAGSSLALLVNSQLLLQVQDFSFSQGRVGLGLLTRTGPAEVHFTEFVLVGP
jgi:hypothetical protein